LFYSTSFCLLVFIFSLFVFCVRTSWHYCCQWCLVHVRIFFGDVIFTFFKFLVLFDHLILIFFWEEVVVEDENQHVYVDCNVFCFWGRYWCCDYCWCCLIWSWCQWWFHSRNSFYCCYCKCVYFSVESC
jgi:hypothetical protein